MPELKKILGDGFEIEDINKLISTFHNFAIGKRYPNKIFEIINASKIGDGKKKTLKEVVQKIHDKIELDEVSTSITSNFLRAFGFPHTHGFKTVTEFRPISNGKEGIKKNYSFFNSKYQNSRSKQ